MVALKVGVWLETGLLFTSLRVTDTVEVADPLAMTGLVPVIVELAATAEPAVKITVPSALATGVAMDNVFVSALVDAKVQVDTPDAFVDEQVPYVLAVPVLVALYVGVWPETGLLFTSLKVMVTVEVAVPFATTGLVPVIVEVAATAEPAVKTTVPSALATGVAIDKVFVSALVDDKVQVETPDAFVAEQAP